MTPAAKSVLAIVLAVVALLVCLSIRKVSMVREGANGILFWNSEQALLFVDVQASGARLNYLRYTFDLWLVSLGDVRSSDRKRCVQTFVIEITDKQVQTYTTDIHKDPTETYCFGDYVVFNGQIFTWNLTRGPFWKWTDNHFEAATPEELRGFNPVNALTQGYQFDGFEGWSMRKYALGNNTFHIALNGHTVDLVSSGRTAPYYYDEYVELVRSGQAPQRIWSFDDRSHRVSRAEYERLFP